MDIAIIGLGQMGAGLARQLIDAGHRATVWNRDRTKAEPFEQAGVSIAGSPAEAARTGVVLTMLANDEALEAVAFAADGLLAAGPGVLHVSCSTVSVALTQRLAVAHATVGQRFVSAQVLGRPDVAAAGRLSVIAAGAASDLDAAQPAFDAIGSQTIRMGERPAMAAAAKAAANFGIAAIIETISEQMRIAGAQGVAPGRMAELLIETDFGARIFASYAPMIAEKRFEPAGFPLRLGRKDVGLAVAAADGALLAAHCQSPCEPHGCNDRRRRGRSRLVCARPGRLKERGQTVCLEVRDHGLRDQNFVSEMIGGGCQQKATTLLSAQDLPFDAAKAKLGMHWRQRERFAGHCFHATQHRARLAIYTARSAVSSLKPPLTATI